MLTTRPVAGANGTGVFEFELRCTAGCGNVFVAATYINFVVYKGI